MRELRLGPLYPVTAVPNRHELDHLDLARLFLEAGISLFQIRDKHSEPDVLIPQLAQAVRRASACGAQLIVNDRVDLARECGAAGVHLGQDDMPVDLARRQLGDRVLIGLSTHTPEQFEDACGQDVDYVAIGPVFPSSTKTGGYPPLGVEAVARIVRVRRHPVVAIGGITLETAPLLWRAGVDAVAVIADVIDAKDPVARIHHYLEAAAAL